MPQRTPTTDVSVEKSHPLIFYTGFYSSLATTTTDTLHMLSSAATSDGHFVIPELRFQIPAHVSFQGRMSIRNSNWSILTAANKSL